MGVGQPEFPIRMVQAPGVSFLVRLHSGNTPHPKLCKASVSGSQMAVRIQMEAVLKEVDKVQPPPRTYA